MKLFPYQQEAVEFAVSRKRVFVADEAGLGKTAVAIRTAQELCIPQTLIVCPAFLRPVWEREIVKWGADPKKFSIVSYNHVGLLHGVKALRKQFKVPSHKIPLLVADEAHYLKNWKANRTKHFVKQLAAFADRVLLLSGTPLTKSAADLHPLYSVMQPSQWGKFKYHCERYCNKVDNPFSFSGYSYEGVKNEDELRHRAKEFMIRRFKADVIKDLPDKVYSTIPVELPRSLAADEEAIKILEGIIDRAGAAIPEHIAKQRQEVGLAKIPFVVEIVENIGKPTVVFAHHRKVVLELTKVFSEKGKNVACIMGGMSDTHRLAAVDNFQSGKLDVIVVGIQAGGVGITLTTASHCVFAELSYSAVEMDQAEDRLHRIGQRQCVSIYHVIGRKTLDDAAMSASERKRKTLTKSVG